jgi:hypothetical protein
MSIMDGPNAPTIIYCDSVPVDEFEQPTYDAVLSIQYLIAAIYRYAPDRSSTALAQLVAEAHAQAARWGTGK